MNLLLRLLSIDFQVLDSRRIKVSMRIMSEQASIIVDNRVPISILIVFHLYYILVQLVYINIHSFQASSHLSRLVHVFLELIKVRRVLGILIIQVRAALRLLHVVTPSLLGDGVVIP